MAQMQKKQARVCGVQISSLKMLTENSYEKFFSNFF